MALRLTTLARRSLEHYRRTHAAVVLGVATAVAVLAGSLLVGTSMRASLARLALERLGRTSVAVESARFFREDLAEDLGGLPAFTARFAPAAPLVALPTAVVHSTSGRQATQAFVYGADARFFALHGVAAPQAFDGRSALLSAALAAELQAQDGDSVLVKLLPASEIPGSTLFGRRDEPGRRLRVRVRGVLPRGRLGGFALRPQQHETRAVFVPLATLQQASGLDARVNTLLVAGAHGRERAPAPRDDEQDAAAGEPRDGRAAAAAVGAALAQAVTLTDLGLRLRALPQRGELALESASTLLADDVVQAGLRAAREQGLAAHRVFIYLATSLRAGEHATPYSLVAALDHEGLRRLPGAPRFPTSNGDAPPIFVNAWAADDLALRPGDALALEYDLWSEDGRLLPGATAFRVAGIVPLEGAAADRDLVPEYPGITESPHLADWDPPFPVDLRRIRPKDEDYWERWRTTPKAFVPLDVAQRLWGHRLGRVTSLRLVPPAGAASEGVRERYAAALQAALVKPRSGGDHVARLLDHGLAVTPVRAQALAAARGATDFGAYFVYFSFFLVVAALLLAGLFFRLGLEQRLREVGLLRAVGFAPRQLFRQFLGEGGLLAAAGALLGTAGAVFYAGAMVAALRTVWVDAVGTRDVTLTVTAGPLLAGAAGGALAAVLASAWTLRDLLRRSPRALLAGAFSDWSAPARRGGRGAAVLLAFALLLLGGAFAGRVPAAAAFFGAGTSLLAAALLAIRGRVAGRPSDPAAVRGVVGLGGRGVSFRPGRSLLCITLVAAAAFVIVSVGAFRHDGTGDLRARDSAAGGFTLLARSLQPLHHGPHTAAGRAALGLPEDAAFDGVTFARFRVSAGEDASCLNLYRPTRPTVLGVTPDFTREGRFAFQSSLAETPEERANPWRLLERDARDGAIPVVADAGSLAYVLHKKVGDELELAGTGVRVRIVAALRPGLFQGELLTGERHFQRAFPGEHGFGFFLIDAPPGREDELTALVESRLADYGYDVSDVAARLLAYHRVENTYIAAFQTLGALGLVLGTLGVATVLVRNAFERRRELALLRAVGYERAHLRRMVLAENALLLGLGLLSGCLAALLAVAPALFERGGGPPLVTLGLLAAAVGATGVVVSWLAVNVVARLPLLASLRSE